MVKDTEGIEREVNGYSKTPDLDDECSRLVRYILKPIDLEFLRNLFSIPEDPDLIKEYEINIEQAKALQPYVIDGEIDLNKYDFFIGSCQAKGWDWSEGYPPKKIDPP